MIKKGLNSFIVLGFTLIYARNEKFPSINLAKNAYLFPMIESNLIYLIFCLLTMLNWPDILSFCVS